MDSTSPDFDKTVNNYRLYRYRYLDEIKERIGFLDYILQHSSAVKLGIEQV